MKVSVEITPGVKEPYAVIYTAQVTEEIQRTIDLLGTGDTPVTAYHEAAARLERLRHRAV